MTEETHAIEQSQLQRSAWHAFVVERARIDLPGDRNAEKIQGVIGELAQRLAALKEWDRYDRFNPFSVTLKEGYREVGRLDGHAGWVKSVQALSDGRIVSGDADSMACVWSPMPDGRWVCDVLPHNNPVRSVARMFDQRVVSGSADGIVRLWTHNGEHGWIAERVIARSSAVECLQTLPDGSIVTGYQDGSLTISKIVNKRWTHGFIATKSTVYALQGLPDGRIVIAHENGDVCWWRQSESGGWDYSSSRSFADNSLRALQVLPDGRVLVGGDDWVVRELPPHGMRVTRIGNHEGRVHCLQAVSDGRVVTGGKDGKIKVWKVDGSGEWEGRELGKHAGCVYSLQVLPDGRIISAGSDNTIRIWDGALVSNGGAS